MKLNQLRDALAVAEASSVRAAARSLGVAQSALTRSIQELERELGVPLFERQARGVSLTPMGALFVRRAQSVRNELRLAREEIDQARGHLHGRVRVCLSSVSHIALLPYALNAFRARYPQVHLDVSEGLFPESQAALIAGVLDCYIGPPPRQAPGPDLAVEQLFENTRVILGRKGHPLKGAGTLASLVDAEWVATSVTSSVHDELGPLFTQRGLPPPRLVMQTHSALSLVIALVYSDLLAMLPVQWLDFPLTRDALQFIDVGERLAAPPVCIVRRAAMPLTPAADYFVDMMRRASVHHVKAAARETPAYALRAAPAGPATAAPARRRRHGP